MNQRIKELEPQCWEMNEFGLNFNYEKFAELIVRECLTICEELGDEGMDGHYCADAISKTFRS
jgi:hypothetical protein